MVSPAPHGYDLTPGDRRLLRGAPPEPALAWCAAAVGPGARVERVAALDGGTSSAVHAVDVVDAGGRAHRLVLRRFVRADWLAREPDIARREGAALALLAGSEVPAPALVALDPDGREAGAPAVLMTRLAGRGRVAAGRPRALPARAGRGAARRPRRRRARGRGHPRLPPVRPRGGPPARLDAPPRAVVAGVRGVPRPAAVGRAPSHPPRLPPRQRPVGGRRARPASSTG